MILWPDDIDAAVDQEIREMIVAVEAFLARHARFDDWMERHEERLDTGC